MKNRYPSKFPYFGHIFRLSLKDDPSDVPLKLYDIYLKMESVQFGQKQNILCIRSAKKFYVELTHVDNYHQIQTLCFL